MQDVFHLLSSDIELPDRLNNPFDYEPHPLCVEAARQVCEHLKASPLWDEVMQGKMLGVLICEDEQGQLGFLAAYSGQLGGRADWPWFVPAVFDYLQPEGYFKREEAEISAINHRISEMEASSKLAKCRTELKERQAQADEAIAAYKQMMAESKKRRHEQPDGDAAELIRESQFQKAELRRLKKRWTESIAEVEAQLRPMEEAITTLKEERKRRSDALQRWLFDQFQMLNADGERRTLTAIFSSTPQQVPPAGAGECCAPKLLQYAFSHLLRPVQIAEFWQGSSPRMEVRHHGHYYPACRGKCKPILEWMLESLSPNPSPKEREVISFAADNLVERSICSPLLGRGVGGEAFLVIDKPAGLLSVPGKTGEESVESLLRLQYGEVYMVHRLDQDTSGLMVVALTREAYRHLQRQFLARTIYKRYIALLDGSPQQDKGRISLPLRPDPLDRPRQVVDFEHGKEAVTDFEVLDFDLLPPEFQQVQRLPNHHYTLVALTPHTGRTHQLRMHCAHQQGLGCPIVGDRLYGTPASRLCLHAAELSFDHPTTGERLHFSTMP